MKKLDAYPVYLISEGAFALFFSTIITVNLVYQVEVAHLNPLQLVLVGTVWEGTAFLLEIPTGIVADVYSRRLSIIVGTIIMGFGFVLEGSIPRFEAILFAQVIWGLGYTFTSGATQAWISDEIGEENAGRAFVRASQMAQVGDLLGVGFSIALASVMLQLPILVGGILIGALGVFQILFMRETAFKRAAPGNRSSWLQMRHTLRGGLLMIRRRPTLIMILSTMAVYGAFSEGFDRLWTPHLLTNFALPALGQFAPVAWFGVIRAVGSLLAVGAMAVVERRVDMNSHRSIVRSLLLINTIQIVAVMTLGLATSFALALVVLTGILPFRRINSPIQTAWVNLRLDPQVRATVISMSSQADALGQIIGGPILGLVATLATTRVEMVVAALVLAPVLLLYWRTLRQPETETHLAPTRA